MYSFKFISQLLSMLICPIENHLMKDSLRLNRQRKHTFGKKNLNYLFDKVAYVKNDNNLSKKFRDFFQKIENTAPKPFFDQLISHLGYEKKLATFLSRFNFRKTGKEKNRYKISQIKGRLKRSFRRKRISYYSRIHPHQQPLDSSSIFELSGLKIPKIEACISQKIFQPKEKKMINPDSEELNLSHFEKPIEKISSFSFHGVVHDGHQEWLELLLESGISLENNDENGFTALHHAALRNNLEKILFLLNIGMDIEAKDYKNRTPLHHASIMNNQQIAELLIQKGANIEARDDAQATPLHHAANWNSVEVAQVLIQAGAYIEARDETQSTPLHHAASWNSPQVAKLLLRIGADINATDECKFRPLEYANKTNSYETFSVLNQQ